MKVLSLFCGCGGLDMGFANAGYDIIWANDIDHYACQTYAANFGNHVIEGDIFKIKLEDLPAFDTDTKGLDGRVRFKSVPYTFGQHQVLISKEWYERQRQLFIAWYNSL